MSRGGRDFEQALLAFNELGYSVDAFILNAKHWTPQSRARLFVVANRDSVREGRTFAMKSDSRPDALFDFINRHQNIRWDIRDLPALPKPMKRLADIVEDLPGTDPHWWNKKRTDYFMSQLSAKHKEQAKQMIEGKSVSYATAFRRVRHEKSMAELRTDGLPGACERRGAAAVGKSCLRQGVAIAKYAFLQCESARDSKGCPTLTSFTFRLIRLFWFRRRRMCSCNRMDNPGLPHAPDSETTATNPY